MSIGSSIASGTIINLGSTALVRTDKTLSTGSLANAATGTGTVTTSYYSANLLKIASDTGGYLVLYASTAARTGDVRTLPAVSDPTDGTGILADFQFPVGGDTLEVSPPVVLYNIESVPVKEVYWKFYRSEAGTGTATITLTITGLDS